MAASLEQHHETVSNRSSSTGLKWVLIFVIPAVLLAGGYYYWQESQKVESTDDAQIDGSLFPVSARIAGQVSAVMAQDQTLVNQGDVLVQMDKRDLEVALARAKADLADAEAAFQSARNDVPVASISSSSTLNAARSGLQDAAAAVAWSEQQLGAARARLTTAQANVKVAQVSVAKAAQDADRYKGLAAKDLIPRQTYDQAVLAVDEARATVDAQTSAVAEAQLLISVAEKAVEQARARMAQAEANLEGAGAGPQLIKVAESKAIAAGARIAQKRAEVEQAELNLRYTTITAQATGIVGRKSVELGQNISGGQQLMVIVPLEGLYVTANFKENQLKNMKVGQPVRFVVDANGHSYSGKVERIAAASGARFSLLPPENATGNFVKVVQRIPVRISIDPGQNQDHVLRLGMSVTPEVSIR